MTALIPKRRSAIAAMRHYRRIAENMLRTIRRTAGLPLDREDGDATTDGVLRAGRGKFDIRRRTTLDRRSLSVPAALGLIGGLGAYRA